MALTNKSQRLQAKLIFYFTPSSPQNKHYHQIQFELQKCEHN